MIFHQVDIVTLGRLATIGGLHSLSRQAILRKILTKSDITARITDAIPNRKELTHFWWRENRDPDARLAFSRKFWCSYTEPLTPEIARNLIGQDICVLHHASRVSGTDKYDSVHDVHSKMMHVAHMNILIEEDAGSGYFMADDSYYCKIGIYESSGILAYLRSMHPYYVFISGPHSEVPSDDPSDESSGSSSNSSASQSFE